MRRVAVVLLGAFAFLIASAGLTAPEPAAIQFQEIAAKAELHFVLRDSATPLKHQIETMVGGIAVFDYNNDDRPDVYFVNGASQPELEKTNSSLYNRLYRNNADGTFTDVTLEAGVRGHGFTTGVPIHRPAPGGCGWRFRSGRIG